MIRTILAVLRKELIDAMRDRRAWMVILVTSLVSGPLTLVLLAKTVADFEERARQREVYMVGAERAPELVNFFARQGRTPAAPPADYAQRITSGEFAQAVLEIDADFARDFARGAPAAVRVIYDENRSRSVASARVLQGLVQEFAREARMQRLAARGVAPGLMAVVRVDEINLGNSRGRFTQMLFMVPMMALIAALVGAITVAIDVTAGERERGSLEPLLMNPVSPFMVVIGKWSVVSIASLTTLALSIASFAAAGRLIGSETLAALFQFGAREIGLFAALLAPYCMMMSAVLMLVAIFARSFKEAQAYTSYLVTLVGFVPMITVFLSLRDSLWMLFVPALAQNMVLSRALRGGPADMLDIAVPALVCLALAALAIYLQSYLLRRESIVFARSA